MNNDKIHNPILRQWWNQEFQGKDHQTWPFCDASYSTVMPGADFTIAIRELLVNREFEAIRELLWLTGNESAGWRMQLDKIVAVFEGNLYDDTIEGRMKAETDAIVALGLRASFARMRGEGFVIDKMARNSVPLWRLDSQNVEMFREMPPTCRDMVSTAVTGMVGELLRFRPQGGYGERCYGNNSEWNLRFVEHTRWFRSVSEKHTDQWIWVDHCAREATRDIIEKSNFLWSHAGEHFFEERWRQFLDSGVARLMPRKDGESLADWMDRSFELQSEVVFGSAEKASGNQSLQLDLYPAWEITCRNGNNSWKERWEQAGGRIYPSLVDDKSERGIALKSDPIWRALGNAELFPDGLEIDYPPFYFSSGLDWIPIDKTECVLLGLLAGTTSPDRRARYVEIRKRSEDRLKQSIIRAQEEYERRNSPEVLLEREKIRQEWWELLCFSETVVEQVKSKVEEGDESWLSETEEKIKLCLRHEKLFEKPRAHGALLRAQGHITEGKGLQVNAKELYEAALELDPKAGCRKDLVRIARLLGGSSR